MRDALDKVVDLELKGGSHNTFFERASVVKIERSRE